MLLDVTMCYIDRNFLEEIVTGVSVAGAPVLIVMVWGIAKSFTENVTDTQVRYCLQLGE